MRFCLLILCCCLWGISQAQTVAFTNPAHGANSKQSIWTVIVNGYQLNHYPRNKRVRYFANYYKHHRAELEAILNAGRPYLFYIVRALKYRKMPLELALLPAVESGFRPTVASSYGAMGLWQLIPSTAQTFDVLVDDYWFDGRADFTQATYGALGYLDYLYDYFDHNWDLAIAAYNSGEGTVQRAIAKNKSRRISTHFFNLQLPKETRDYLPKLLAIAFIVKNPKRYGIHLPKISNSPVIKKVLMRRQISLSTAASFAGLSSDEVETLNPGYTYGVLPGDGPSYLYLPNDQVSHFEYEARKHPYHEYWNLYRVQPGEFLASIAKDKDTSIGSLIDLNNLQTSVLQPKQRLIIPASNGRTHGIYRIKRGDTLSDIARKFTTSVPEIRMTNGLDPKAPIHAGDRILVN